MKKKFMFIGVILLAFAYFWYRASTILDPDFGWHVRVGEFLLRQGIPYTDPFSYTMPSYPFVSHEWLLDLLLSSAFHFVGMLGLGAIFSFLAVSALVICLGKERKNLSVASLLPIGLAVLAVGNFVGIRPQVLSWVFFSVVLVIVRDKTLFHRWKWCLPLLFLLWANMHASFPVGLFVLFLGVWYWWRKKKLSLSSGVLVLVASLVSTFITPYGSGMWWEVWMSVTDSSLRWTIQEWMPPFFSFSFSFWLLTLLSGFFVYRYRIKLSLFDRILYLCLLVAAVSSSRLIPFFVFIALPLAAQFLSRFQADVSKIPHGKTRLKTLFIVLSIVCFLLCLPDGIQTFSARADIPSSGALVYLKAHPAKGEIFAPYNWGGYLLWQLPEKKVFIDGRMPSWRREKAPAGESVYALKEYKELLNDKISLTRVTEKYTIQTIILPVTQSPVAGSFMAHYLHWANHTFGLALPESVLFARMREGVEKAGWRNVYDDGEVVIYRRITPSGFPTVCHH